MRQKLISKMYSIEKTEITSSVCTFVDMHDIDADVEVFADTKAQTRDKADVEASADTKAQTKAKADVEASADTTADTIVAKTDAHAAAEANSPLMSEVKAFAYTKVIEVTSFLSEIRFLNALKAFVVTDVMNALPNLL